jgi:hypothetical protein
MPQHSLRLLRRWSTSVSTNNHHHPRWLLQSDYRTTSCCWLTSTTRDATTTTSTPPATATTSIDYHSTAPHYSVIPKFDHGAYTEYSVIHTDRSLNLMSDPFQRVMRDLNYLLKYTYQADKVVIIPGYVCVYFVYCVLCVCV